MAIRPPNQAASYSHRISVVSWLLLAFGIWITILGCVSYVLAYNQKEKTADLFPGIDGNAI